MITEGVLLSLVFSGILLLMGAKKNARPLIFISSLGWMICGLQLFQQTEEILPTILLMMLAVSQFMLFGVKERTI